MYVQSHFIIVSYVIATDKKNPLSTNRGLVELLFVPIMEYYVAVKRNERPLYKGVWTDLPDDTLQSKKVKGRAVCLIGYLLCLEKIGGEG